MTGDTVTKTRGVQEEVKDWETGICPDENGHAYETNLLKSIVEINGLELRLNQEKEQAGEPIFS